MTITNGILESIDREDINFGKVIIPEGVTVIGACAFKDNPELIEIELPSTLKKIEDQAFYRCEFLKEIKLNKGLEEIGEAAFYRCDSLTNITIPNTVTKMGSHVFAECSYLKEVKLSENLSSISSCAFFGCTILNEIELPKNISMIENSAFEDCLSIRKITIPKKAVVGRLSFNNCRFLSRVIIEEGVEKIDEGAFENCLSLRIVNLPKSLKSIGNSAFKDCRSISEIDIPETIEVIESKAFSGTGIKEISFPQSIKVIPPALCRNCFNLERIYFHEKIEGICKNSFEECTSLSEIIINNQKIDTNHSTRNVLINYLYFCANEILKDKYKNLSDFLENSNIGDLGIPAVTDAGFMKDSILKFKNIFKKLRKSYDVPPNILRYLRKETTEDFSYKIWNQIKEIYTWEWHEEEREKALAEMIEVFGLFHKDKNQKKRIDTFLKLFTDFSYTLFDTEIKELIYEEFKEYEKEIKEAFEKKKVQFYFANNISIPEEFSVYLNGVMTLSQVAKIKKLSGSYGKRINDFIKESYLLKEVEVYTLKEEKKADSTMKLVSLANTLENHLNHDAIHRIFDGCDFPFNESFYEFLIENLELILTHPRIQSKIREIGKCFESIENYYRFSSGIEKPSLKQALDYLEIGKFHYKEGNLEFANELQKAGVTNVEKYNYYEKIYEENKTRRLYSLVRRSNIYEIDGYTIKAELLRKDDPFTLVVGESNYTNCCQRYGSVGHNCLTHAACSPSGGIFVTRLLKDGVWQLLTESWDWQNNNLYCHDNIEGTELLKKGGTRLKRAVAEAFRLDGEVILEKSKKEVEEYAKLRRKKLEKSASPEREEELRKLKELEEREIVKVVTCGTGYDDLGLGRFFKNSIKVNQDQFINGQVFHLSNFQPVNYNSSMPYFDKEYRAYSDAKEFQYIMAGNIEDLRFTTDEDLVPIYRDERRVLKETKTEVRNHTAKKIADMEKISYPRGMLSHQKISQANFKDSDVYLGEDWYLICENKEDHSVYIADLVRVEPTLKDEKKNQLEEIKSTIDQLLNNSCYIEADLKEDTSYILYLINKRLGYIEQIGEDISYLFGLESSQKIVTEEEQEEILRNYKKQEDKNSYTMHKVFFKSRKK